MQKILLWKVKYLAQGSEFMPFAISPSNANDKALLLMLLGRKRHSHSDAKRKRQLWQKKDELKGENEQAKPHKSSFNYCSRCISASSRKIFLIKSLSAFFCSTPFDTLERHLLVTSEHPKDSTLFLSYFHPKSAFGFEIRFKICFFAWLKLLCFIS